MLKVKRRNESNSYCGPAAISLMTGIDVDEAAARIRAVTGKRAVYGVNNSTMYAVLRDMGYAIVQLPIAPEGEPPPTLAKWLRWTRKERKPGVKWLINVTRHYVVVEGVKIADNTHTKGIFSREWPHRRVRVKHVWRISNNGTS